MENTLKYTLIIIGIVIVGGVSFLARSDENVGGTAFNSAKLYTAATSGPMTVTSDVQILATSTRRAYAIICNDSSQVVYLGINNDVAVNSNNGIRLNASGGCYEINDQNLYAGSVRASSTNETASKLLINSFDF